MAITVPLNDLYSRNNPRPRPGKVTEIKYTLLLVGLIHPLLVEGPDESGKYNVRGGSRRLAAIRACKKAGKEIPRLSYDAIPCELLEADADLIALAENVHKALAPSELGNALIKLMQNGTTLTTAARAAGLDNAKARLHILLAQAPASVRKKVDAGEMSLSAFKAIMMTPAEDQEEIAAKEGRVTVAQAKHAVCKQQQNGRQALDEIINQEESVVMRLNGIHADLENILSGTIGVRERFVLDKILSLLQE